MFNDLLYIFVWWGIIFYIGITFFPLTIKIFPTFFDKGYIFSKILGLILVSYTLWVFSSLKILPFTTSNIILVIGLFLVINIFILLKFNLLRLIIPRIRYFLFEEIIFILGLITWSFVRGFEPSIQGLEKFMDFGFINSILKTEYFPPKDLWLPPESINYYYFGHLVAAVLTKLSTIDSIITYNLMVATIFALSFSATFSIGSNLFYTFLLESDSTLSKKTKTSLILIAGLLSACLVNLAGNLHTVYAFFKTYDVEKPIPFFQLPLMLNFIGYWYPNATRFIIHTIHEFPLYSFVVSDLHGHVFNIPFVLLMIALFISIYIKEKFNLLDISLLALLIAVFLMTNVLDGPIYILGVGMVLIIKFLQNKEKYKKISFKNPWIKSFIYTPAVALGAVIFSLPFWLSFKPFSSGIGVLCSPPFLIEKAKIGPLLFEADHCDKSPIWMLIILYGFFYFVLLSFVLFCIRLNKRSPLLKSYHLVILFSLFSTILIFIPEIVYVKDIYPTHYRANTVFKFQYQAFILLSIAAGFMILTIFTTLSKYKLKDLVLLTVSKFIILIMLILVFIYPYFAIRSYYGNLNKYEGLDGLVYIKKTYPDDYNAILYLRENVKNQPVILEAQGDSYTDFARISANTGLPTVVGWPVHEWLWRGSYGEPATRITQIKELYEGKDLEKTQELIKKYNIRLVVVGSLEKQKYLDLNEDKFKTLGKSIFNSGATTIYLIN